jgi:predicted glycosyltransferase involved in capsule biosynthesis
MHQFFKKLLKKNLVSNYHVYIVEQSNDGRKFNRGKLLNIGFDYARKQNMHDVFIYHDVDLLPQDDLGEWYAKFPKTPIHIARVWDRYSNNPKYFGGVVSFSSSDYRRINGYPNTFWGWGGEDDEMQKRLENLGMKWEWPPKGTLVDLEAMTLTEKLDFLRQNKEWKCMVKWEALEEHEKTWKTNGLADLKYKVLGETPLDENKKSTKLTVDVMLNGNHWANDKCSVSYMGT